MDYKMTPLHKTPPHKIPAAMKKKMNKKIKK